MHVFAMTIDHRYSSKTMGQVEAAPGQIETPSEMSEHGLENALF